MSKSTAKNPYEGRIRIGNQIVYTVTGNSINELQALLHGRCQIEESGAEGEIIELSSGQTVSRCRKETIIDQ